MSLEHPGADAPDAADLRVSQQIEVSHRAGEMLPLEELVVLVRGGDGRVVLPQDFREPRLAVGIAFLPEERFLLYDDTGRNRGHGVEEVEIREPRHRAEAHQPFLTGLFESPSNRGLWFRKTASTSPLTQPWSGCSGNLSPCW